MQHQRLKKLNRILRFQQQQLEAIERSIVQQRRQLDQLLAIGTRLRRELDAIDQGTLHGQSIVRRQSQNQWQIFTQTQLDLNGKNIAAARQQLSQIIHAYRQQKDKVQLWERLLTDQTREYQLWRDANEMRNADELFVQQSQRSETTL